MKPFKNRKVLARFAPVVTDDLDPELIKLVGSEAVFTYHNFVDNEDTPCSEQMG
jgi:hypothetical protein